MKNKIKGFAKGNFQMERPEIRFSDAHILITAGEGELYQGSFQIKNEKDGDIRGLVYPSSFRVRFTNQGFEGNPVELKFVYDTTGMRPGQVENGKFTVVCNGGEYELRFTAIIEKPYIVSKYGKIQTIQDLKKLAMEDFVEANRIFRMRQFGEILRYEDDRIRNLYTNIRKWALDERALEEFLVGIKQKEKIFLTLSEDRRTYENLLDDRKDTIEVQKNTWGYGEIHIWSDAEFIQIEKALVTTDDFLGNQYELPYEIVVDKLHTGKNYGVIYLDTPYETLGVEVRIFQQGKKDAKFGMTGMMAGQGLKHYLAYLGGKTDKETWGREAVECVTKLRDANPDDIYYQFLLCHVYLMTEQEEEARWLMEQTTCSRQTLGKKPELLGYYLFLQALLRKEPGYTAKVVEELTKLFMKNLYSWPLLCMVVNLDHKYRDYSERIRVYERQFSNGANHVLMYAEAYQCYRDNVLLLRKFGAFEIQIMDFASKYGILTRELALYFADLVIQQRRYDKRFLRILKRAYKVYEEPAILQAICNQLITGNHRDKESFRWYEKAVEEELKIAQLYEYYMLAVDEEYLKKPFPQIVYLYFLHGNSLGYQKKALLYANLLTHEPDDSPLVKQYIEEIHDFTWEQLLLRHISKALRILYKRFIKENEMKPEHYEALHDICYAYRIQTDRKDMKYVLVIEKDGSVVQRVPHKDGGAVVYLYDKEARIIWESREGVHYTDSIPYDTIRLFYETSFMSLCRKYRAEKEAVLEERVRLEVSFENLKKYGLSLFSEQEVFLYCSRYLREEEEPEDDFVTYLCFELLKRGMYDKVLIAYLCRNYCGATADMKQVWNLAREYGLRAHELAERILTQMLYTEDMFGEDRIFQEYCKGKAYFRLKQAYFAFVSREYVVSDRQSDRCFFELMLQDAADKEYLADICKVAALKYYAGQTMSPEVEELLFAFFQECCGKGLIFPFYMQYPMGWLRQVQLHDKILVTYRSTKRENRVRLQYRIGQNQAEGLGMKSEVLLPMYENLYVKTFVIYEDECLKYQFVEEAKEGLIEDEKRTVSIQKAQGAGGIYGRINEILALEEQLQQEAMAKICREQEAAMQLFPIG